MYTNNRCVRLCVLTASLATVMLAGPSWAQTSPAAGTTAQPTATPRPDELEPGVNTSTATPSTATPAPASTAPVNTPAPGAAPATNTRPATVPAPLTGAAATKDSTAAAPAGKATAANAAARSAPGAPSAGASAARPAGGSGKAQDRIQLDTTQITGNRELPKVLYIVPWKRSDLGDLVGRPVNSLLDEVLAPVDRDVFNRQNRYYDALRPDAGASQPQPAAAGSDAPH
jgi:hypothetical protein